MKTALSRIWTLLSDFNLIHSFIISLQSVQSCKSGSSYQQIKFFKMLFDFYAQPLHIKDQLKYKMLAN